MKYAGVNSIRELILKIKTSVYTSIPSITKEEIEELTDNYKVDGDVGTIDMLPITKEDIEEL